MIHRRAAGHRTDQREKVAPAYDRPAADRPRRFNPDSVGHHMLLQISGTATRGDRQSMSYFKPASVVGGGMLLAVVLAIAVAQEPTSRRQAFREIYQELVEINTTNSVADSLRAAEAMAARLKAGGLPPDNVQVLSSAPRRGTPRVALTAAARASSVGGTLRPSALAVLVGPSLS